MRRLLLPGLLILAAGCRESVTAPAPTAVAAPAAKAAAATVPLPDSGDIAALNRVLHSYKEPEQRFHVPAGARQLICGAKGTRLWVEPSDLELADGTAPGAVDVTLVELHRQGDFLRNDVATTSNGRLLQSGGSYFIGMRSGGKVLRLKHGSKLRVILPQYARQGMELFYGSNDGGSLNWIPARKAINLPDDSSADAFASRGYPVIQDSIEVRVRVPQYRDSILVDMEVPPGGKRKTLKIEQFRSLSGTRLKLIGGHLYYVCQVPDTSRHVYAMRCMTQRDRLAGQFYDVMSIGQLGWINCDRFVEEKTFVLNAAVNPAAGLSFAKVYLIYRDINSVSKRELAGTELTRTRLDLVPANRPFRLLAISWKGGRPHVFTRDMRVEKDMDVVLDLKPVTEAELQSAMKGMVASR